MELNERMRTRFPEIVVPPAYASVYSIWDEALKPFLFPALRQLFSVVTVRSQPNGDLVKC